MGVALHERQSLKKLAESHQAIEISEKIGSFERLSESIDKDLAATPGPLPDPAWRATAVRGRLEFRYLSPESEAVAMRGRLEAPVPAVCQRCLQVFDWPLVADLHLVFSDPAGTVDDESGAESWELPGDAIDIGDVLDEALVMALPLAAKHTGTAGCAPIEAAGDSKDLSRPFANLRAQMDKKTDNEQ